MPEGSDGISEMKMNLLGGGALVARLLMAGMEQAAMVLRHKIEYDIAFQDSLG